MSYQGQVDDVAVTIPRQKEEKCDSEASEAIARVRQQATAAKVVVGQEDDLRDV
jgi:hypothetical protein